MATVGKGCPAPGSLSSPNAARGLSDLRAGNLLRNASDRLNLISMAHFQVVRCGAESCFENVFGDARRFGTGQSLACTDEFWIQNIYQLAGKRWTIDQWLASVCVDDGRYVVYDESFEWDDSENYSSEEMYGVTLYDLEGLLNGSDGSFGTFLRAEGQLARVILNSPDLPVRLVAFKAWIILVGRFCGGSVAMVASRPLIKFTQGSLHWGSCTAEPGKGMFRAFDNYAKELISCNASWLWATREVNTVREAYIGSWCFDRNVCALHYDRCVNVMEMAAIDWDETRENSPAAEDEYST